MNDITLIRDYGPDAPPASDAAMAAARARVMAATAVPSHPRSPWLGRLLNAMKNVRTRSRLLLAAATVAAAATVTAVVTVAPPQPTGRPVTLVAFSPPEFPLALSPLPSGLSSPSFSAHAGTLTAVYQASEPGNDVYLTVFPRQPSHGLLTEPQAVVIDGKPGQMHAGHMTDTGVNTIWLLWERKPGQWVSVSGHGRFGTEASARALASAIIDRPQRVPLQLSLAPAGWTLDAFKDNTILTLRDAASDDPSRTLTVRAVPRTDPTLAEKVQGGSRRVSTVAVNGRESQLIETDEFWLLQAPLPDGSAFLLEAPSFLTSMQVIAIGEQVSRT